MPFDRLIECCTYDVNSICITNWVEKIRAFNMTDIEKITELDEYIWRTNFKNAGLKQWYSNFDTEEDKMILQKLLSQFLYFDDIMIREMLIALYRDLVLYPIRQQIILNGRLNIAEEIKKTRFLGMGNSSESGTFLLYYFRQINNIKKNLFIDDSKIQLQDNNNEIKRYIYIDDISITGSQVIDYATNEKYTITANKIKNANPDIEINCYLLFATESSMNKIKELTVFNRVESVFELDDSFNCFSDDSRYLKTPEERTDVKNVLKKYKSQYEAGELKDDEIMFGFKESGLLLGLDHNTPNNTLPIFWGNGSNWESLFIRYGKNYEK